MTENIDSYSKEPIGALGYVTTDADGEKTNVPQPKVLAATAGAGVGAAVGVIGVWILEASLGIDVPDPVELSIGVVLTAGLAYLAGYFKRPGDVS